MQSQSRGLGTGVLSKVVDERKENHAAVSLVIWWRKPTAPQRGRKDTPHGRSYEEGAALASPQSGHFDGRAPGRRAETAGGGAGGGGRGTSATLRRKPRHKWPAAGGAQRFSAAALDSYGHRTGRGAATANRRPAGRRWARTVQQQDFAAVSAPHEEHRGTDSLAVFERRFDERFSGGIECAAGAAGQRFVAEYNPTVEGRLG